MTVPLPICAFSGAADAATSERLSRDAEAVAAARRGATFWRALKAAPSCGLEALALELARFHVDQLSLAGVAGVEWWVQVRCVDGSDGSGSILLHYDKDELAFERLGVTRSPVLSTATYLRADAGAAPLVVFDPQFAAVATPAAGKHVAFDGRQLHGVPAELGALFHEAPRTEGKRVSLLANLWKAEPTGATELSDADAAGLGLSPRAPPPKLERSAAAFDDGRGRRKYRLSDDDAGGATPPLPLAARGDEARRRTHVSAALAGILVFRFF